MEQHPVPQQISSYEFRLVGDMTLKQFGMVAGGGIIALISYASPMPWFMKWPLIVISAFAGIAFAFLPFEERPLQTWVIAFLKAVYSPTQYLWQKKPQKPAVFANQTPAKVFEQSKPVIAQDSQRLNTYLSGLQSNETPWEQKEKAFVDNIHNMFSNTSTARITPNPQPAQEKVIEPKVEEHPIVRQIQTGQPSGPAFEIPQEKNIPVEWTRPQVQPRPKQASFPQYRPPLPGNAFNRAATQFGQAQFRPQMPVPSVPSLPNVLVGMVLDTEGKMVESAIIEIRDSQGNPKRATRTNKLGQFQIVNPLADDTYEVEVEKDGLNFDIIKLELTGEIVQPIEIRAK